mmetsp:Transcript_25269/g.60088  ORF Transcript_25269/g.60088 Transcript_25269/m.60088 type:complete len:220 (+) Transcript_25269:321-980(+)
MLEFGAVVQNGGNRLQSLAHAHLICEYSAMDVCHHFLMPHPAEALRLKREQCRGQAPRLASDLSLEVLLHELVGAQLFLLLLVLLLRNVHLLRQLDVVLRGQGVVVPDVLRAADPRGEGRAVQVSVYHEPGLAAEQGTVPDPQRALEDALVARLAGGPPRLGVFHDVRRGLVQSSVAVGLASLGPGLLRLLLDRDAFDRDALAVGRERRPWLFTGRFLR